MNGSESSAPVPRPDHLALKLQPKGGASSSTASTSDVAPAPAPAAAPASSSTGDDPDSKWSKVFGSGSNSRRQEQQEQGAPDRRYGSGSSGMSGGRSGFQGGARVTDEDRNDSRFSSLFAGGDSRGKSSGGWSDNSSRKGPVGNAATAAAAAKLQADYESIQAERAAAEEKKRLDAEVKAGAAKAAKVRIIAM